MRWYVPEGWSKKAIIAYLDHEPLKWRVFLSILIDTGIRRGECAGLKWEDVDFESHTITIKGNLQYTPQKGVYLDTPKNGKHRTIDIDTDSLQLLRELRENNAQSAYVFSQDDSPIPPHKVHEAFCREIRYRGLSPPQAAPLLCWYCNHVRGRRRFREREAGAL